MSVPSRLLTLAVALSALGACDPLPTATQSPSADFETSAGLDGGVQPDAGILAPAGPVDLRADVNRDGVVDTAPASTSDDDADEETWSQTRGAVFLANLDDDSKRCFTSNSIPDSSQPNCHDAADDQTNGADD